MLQRNPTLAPLRNMCFGPSSGAKGGGIGAASAAAEAGRGEREQRGHAASAGSSKRDTALGEEEFRLLGCVLRVFLQPSAAVRTIMQDIWERRVPPQIAPAAAVPSVSSPPSASSSEAGSRPPDGAELVSAHIRLGPKHTSNYVVLPQGVCVCAGSPPSNTPTHQVVPFPI